MSHKFFPGNKDFFQGDADSASLLLDLPAGAEEMRLKFTGNPVVLSKMIAKGMQQKQEIAAAVVAGVLHWCELEGINPDDLKGMVQFHR